MFVVIQPNECYFTPSPSPELDSEMRWPVHVHLVHLRF